MKYSILTGACTILVFGSAAMAEEFTCSKEYSGSCMTWAGAPEYTYGQQILNFPFKNTCGVAINVTAQLVNGDGSTRTERLQVKPGDRGNLECNWPGKVAKNCIRDVTYLCYRENSAGPQGGGSMKKLTEREQQQCSAGYSECQSLCGVLKEGRGSCDAECEYARDDCSQLGKFEMPSNAATVAGMRRARRKVEEQRKEDERGARERSQDNSAPKVKRPAPQCVCFGGRGNEEGLPYCLDDSLPGDGQRSELRPGFEIRWVGAEKYNRMRHERYPPHSCDPAVAGILR